MTVTPADLEHWRSWIGRSHSLTQRIEPVLLDRYAAAIGEARSQQLPSLGHWAFFIDAVPPDRIGADGHPERGGFLPPVTLPRRMFAGSDMTFHKPLQEGQDASRHAEILFLEHKTGRSGDLILMEVLHRIEQANELCITEKQTIIYRSAAGATPPVENGNLPPVAGAETWVPDSVQLFRFSAVTFNSHRIHYDLPYATSVEGYPGLVVHGPLTAARLYSFAQKTHGRPLRRFAFRAQAPLFAGRPIGLAQGDDANEFVARRCDGVIAMQASIRNQD